MIELQDALDAGRRAALGGKVASYIPELAKADPSRVAVAVCTVDGEESAAGDADEVFTLQSVSKVFALARVLAQDDEALWERVSREPSGDAFHSIVRLEEEQGRPRNPLINAGAIVVSERLPGSDPAARIEGLRQYLCARAVCAEERFAVDEPVYLSELRTGYRNRALANYMKHFGMLDDPGDAVDTYFRQCALSCDVLELARAGLFLANGGSDAHSGATVLSATQNRTVVALMATCGLYDEVGRFAVRVGVPAKSGVSGTILAIVPGRMSVACYGPMLGERGNSLAGVAMLEHLSEHLHLSVFEPYRT